MHDLCRPCVVHQGGDPLWDFYFGMCQIKIMKPKFDLHLGAHLLLLLEMADAETMQSLPSHVVPSVPSVIVEKVARADVLAGVYDAAKPPGQGFLAKLLRHKLAFGALPQNVVLGPAEAKVLELKLDTGEEEAEMFSVRFIAWRKLNMRVAGLAIFLRLILSLWILIELSLIHISEPTRPY